MSIQDYMKIKAAAAFLGVSINTLRNWERAGKLATYRHPINSYSKLKVIVKSPSQISAYTSVSLRICNRSRGFYETA